MDRNQYADFFDTAADLERIQTYRHDAQHGCDAADSTLRQDVNEHLEDAHAILALMKETVKLSNTMNREYATVVCDIMMDRAQSARDSYGVCTKIIDNQDLISRVVNAWRNIKQTREEIDKLQSVPSIVRVLTDCRVIY